MLNIFTSLFSAFSASLNNEFILILFLFPFSLAIFSAIIGFFVKN